MDLTRHKTEIEAFRTLWQGGYYEGNPLDPMAPSGYGSFGYMSSLYATYLCCIKPYVNSDTQVLEIGPGRGGWTNCFVKRGAKAVWALDALSAEHNGFWNYVGRLENVKYFQVTDNTCGMVLDDSIDYFFSFGCFCHLSPASINDYMVHVFRKMRPGAHGFFMFADYDKYNSLLAREPQLSVTRAFAGRRFLPIRIAWRLLFSFIKPHDFRFQDKNEDDVPRPGRWYHLGIDNAVAMLTKIGFNVIEKDVGVNHRDPVIHFCKPRA